jgi:hypothetical protein
VNLSAFSQAMAETFARQTKVYGCEICSVAYDIFSGLQLEYMYVEDVKLAKDSTYLSVSDVREEFWRYEISGTRKPTFIQILLLAVHLFNHRRNTETRNMYSPLSPNRFSLWAASRRRFTFEWERCALD